MNVRDLLRTYKEKTNSIHVSHTTWNWSEEEQCVRHPSAPIGWIIRDQGYLDLFAGKTRSILSLKGESVHVATYYSVFSEYINFIPKGIKNFRIGGKHFNESLFKGQKIPALKTPQSMVGKFVIGPQTIWNEQTQQFINPIPLEEVFEVVTIFETPTDDQYLLHPDVEIYNMLKNAMEK